MFMMELLLTVALHGTTKIELAPVVIYPPASVVIGVGEGETVKPSCKCSKGKKCKCKKCACKKCKCKKCPGK